jgi:hypothetical protein
MPIEPPEIPPATPGTPTEPPREDPPGNPRPEIPPPVHEPGEPARPQELPGKMPDEVPLRGPSSPTTPNPATDGAGDNPNSLFETTSVADLTFATRQAANSRSERQIQGSTRIDIFASGPLIPTFAKVPLRWDANVGIGPLA